MQYLSHRSTRFFRTFISFFLFLSLMVSLVPPTTPRVATAAPASLAPPTMHATPEGSTTPTTPSIPEEIIGKLMFAAEIDADTIAATNPTAQQPIPVMRVGTAPTIRSLHAPVFHATIGIATEVIPDNTQRNPAGTLVTFRLWNDTANVDITRVVRADAWGAAFTEILLDELHLKGQFSYQASAPGFGQTPVRHFTCDTTRYSHDTQLGAATITTQVEPDGRLVVDIVSDVAIDEQLGAVQLTAVKTIPVTEEPGMPDIEPMPPLIGKRIDAHHARAEIYLDAGYYMVQAHLSAHNGTIEATSAPALAHVEQTITPPIEAVEGIVSLNSDSQVETALVQYRAPDGNAVLGYRPTDEISQSLAVQAAQETQTAFFQHTTRRSPFSYATTTYSLTTHIRTDDGAKHVTLDNFSYDPMVRRYDFTVEFLKDAPVQDTLTVDVLGPNGVIIYHEQVSVTLDPANPLHYSVNVPTDRGEPYGIRVTLDDPYGLDWFLEKSGAIVSSVFQGLSGIMGKYGTASASFSEFLQIIGLQLFEGGLSCSIEEGCLLTWSDKVIDIASGKDVSDSDGGAWYEKVLFGISNKLRSQFDLVDTTGNPSKIINEALDEIGEQGFAIGAIGFSGSIEAGVSFATFAPSKCSTEEDAQNAKEYTKQIGIQLGNIAERVNQKFDTIFKDFRKDAGVWFNFPYPALASFLGIRYTPSLAFKASGGSRGDYWLYAGAKLTIDQSFGVAVRYMSWYESAKSSLKMIRVVGRVYQTIEAMRTAYELFSLISSATKLTGRNCDPPKPNGYPDDRRDAFQNQHDMTPEGARGRILTLQQQIAIAEQAGLLRAKTYYMLQLRHAELEAFDADTTNTISMTNEMEAMYAATEQRMQGILDGTILPEAGQTISDTLAQEYGQFSENIANTSVDKQRQVLLDSVEFAQRHYNNLRGQELALQQELRQMAQAAGVGIVDSGLVTWALGAIGSMGIHAMPVQVVPGMMSSGLPESRYYDPFEAPPTLIVPTGGFYRLRTSQEAHDWFETYVSSGGTLIVLSQHDDDDWEMLPGGEVRGIGYANDILCKTASVQIINSSRWITGISRNLPDIQVDGSLTQWPSNATVVLMRTSGSKLPAMIEYPYGNGQVVVTTAYPDFAGINGMQSREDVIFARSLFGNAYLEGIGEQVAASASVGGTVSFNMVVTNTGTISATYMSIYSNYYHSGIAESWRWDVHSDIDVLASYMVNLDPPLAPGASRTVRVSFPAPSQAGLFRSAYSLREEYGWWWGYTEFIPGPFYQVRSDAVALDLLTLHLQSDQEAYAFGESAFLTATIVNKQNTEQTYDLVPINGITDAAQSVTVSAHTTKTVRLRSFPMYATHDVRLEIRQSGKVLSTLTTPLRVKKPTIGVDVTPTAIAAGAETVVDVMVNARNVAEGTDVSLELSYGDAPVTTTSAKFTSNGDYVVATTRITLPGATTDNRYVLRAVLPDKSTATAVVAVQDMARIEGATLQKPLVAGETVAQALDVQFAPTPYAGTLSLVVEVLVKGKQQSTTTTSVQIQPSTDSTHVLLPVLLPTLLHLNEEYTLRVVGTATAAVAAGLHATPMPLASYTHNVQFLPPSVHIADTELRQGETFAVDVLYQGEGERYLPDTATFTLTNVTTGAVYQVVGTVTTSNGQTTVALRQPISSDIQPGTYTMRIASPHLADWYADMMWYIPIPSLAHALSATTANSGDTLEWHVTNSGGAATSVNGEIELTDENGTHIQSYSFTGKSIPLDTAVTFPIALPMLRSGTYLLTWRAKDHMWQITHHNQYITVDGIDMSISTQTEKPLYLLTDTQVNVTNKITSTFAASVNNAALRLRVLSTNETIGHAEEIYETWVALPTIATGTNDHTVPLTNPNLLNVPRARGQLLLEATLFGPEPTHVVTSERQILARSRAPFVIMQEADSVVMAADETTRRINVPNYAPDDAAAEIVLRGAVKNTTHNTTNILLTVRHETTTILESTFTDVPPNETRQFVVTDSSPTARKLTYTASTNLGGVFYHTVNIEAPNVTEYSATISPWMIVQDDVVVAEVVLKNSGTVSGFVTFDWGNTQYDVAIDAGGVVTRTYQTIPYTAGTVLETTDFGDTVAHIPLQLTGDVNQDSTWRPTVLDETVTANLALTGETLNANSFVQDADTSLVVTLLRPFETEPGLPDYHYHHMIPIDMVVDYTLTGQQQDTWRRLYTLSDITTTLNISTTTLPVGTYEATIKVSSGKNGKHITTSRMSFTVVAPAQHINLVVRSGADVTPYAHPDTIIPFEIVASSEVTSNVTWRGMLLLTGAVQDERPLLLAPGETFIYKGGFDLTTDTGLQTVLVTLVNADGTIRHTYTLVVPTAPRFSPKVKLHDVKATASGSYATITVNLSNESTLGDAFLSISAFEQITEHRVTVPNSKQHYVTLTVPIPDGLLGGRYPISVQLNDQEAHTELVLDGAEVALHHTLDAATYEAFATATWTVQVEGTRGAPASYDVFMRYRGEEFTKTIRVGAGDVVSVTWQLNVGSTSDRAAVLLTNHPANDTQARYTIVVDSQYIRVIEDEQVFLESDKQRYQAGETAHLTLHINQPVQTAMVLLPDDMPATTGVVLWSSLYLTTTDAVTGTFAMPLALPSVLPTGRYFIRYHYDGNQRTLPIDVFGATLTTDNLAVTIDSPVAAHLAATMPMPPQDTRESGTVTLSAGTPIVITAKLHTDMPITNTIIMAYVLAPDGTALSLGDGATIQQSLPVGTTPITLTGILQTTQPGSHQIVVRVKDEAATVVLGGDALFVDVGKASISSLTTSKAVYTPGEAATGRLSIHGAGTPHVKITTSDGTVLLDKDVTADGFIEEQFIPPTASERDEVIIATLTGDDGMVSTQQVAYKVATAFDTTPPHVQITSPSSGARIPLMNTNDAHVTITGIVTDNVAVQRVLVNGNAATVDGTQFTAQVTVTQGVQQYEVVANDAANNVATSKLYLIGEPLFGISLSITPTHVRVGSRVNITAYLTTTQTLSATVKFPFSETFIRPISDTANLVSDGFVLEDGVQWRGSVSAAMPLMITWQGVASSVLTPTNVFALMERADMTSYKSNDVQVAISAKAALVYLPIVMKQTKQ